MAFMLVCYPEEMLNDAKGFLQNAEHYASLKDRPVFDEWREVRASVIFAYSALEAFFSWMADGYIKANPELDQATVDYLREQQTLINNGNRKIRKRNISLDEKITGWTKVITGKGFSSDLGKDSLWQGFNEVEEVRHTLIHYRSSRKQSPYSQWVDSARKAVSTAQGIMGRFYQCWGKPIPPWVTAPHIKK